MPRKKRNKVSRQRRWQIVRMARGKCATCGKGPLVTSYYCRRHAEADRKRSLARYHANKEAGE